MIRSVGVAFLSCGIFAGGFALAAVEQKRVRTLRNLLLLISMIESQLRFLCPPVEDLLCSLRSCASLRGFSFLTACLSALRDGAPFASAWAASIRKEPALRGLPETAALITALGATLGAVDVQGQLDHCAQCASQLERQLQTAERRFERSARLFPPLGLLLGAFFALLLFR